MAASTQSDFSLQRILNMLPHSLGQAIAVVVAVVDVCG
jgi:hypothetical protein